ncbi:ATP-binding protein [Streptomyces inhibens]|uniref:ATP-binding protein n=1 Tax=Streptomyces inhibens TaxID=2293571 RepID=UPI001EE6B21F|nr:ATP-binding protein [Streptomyces inhibens]UKY48554.1 ATP-binding protein [Streptomyces inhibens]
MTLPVALPHRHVLTCPAVPSSVRLARREAETTYASWGINPGHPALGPSLLVLSELVTNSVRHAGTVSPHLSVVFAAGADVLAFAVHDRHPAPLDPLSFLQSPGGLATVAEVITDWGGTWTVRPDADGGGKSVWITLPL